jgi:hypothetical protein
MTVKRLDRAQLTSAPAEAPYRRERQRTLPPQPTRHVGPNSMSPIQDPRPTHLMHPGSAQFVVGLMHVCANAEGMGSRGDAEYRARRRERERRRRADQEPAAARRDRSPDVPPVQPGAGGGARRAAATTCGWCNGPITDERAGRSPRGVRPPAGIAPGNRREPPSPVVPPSASSKGSLSPCSPAAGKGTTTRRVG